MDIIFPDWPNGLVHGEDPRKILLVPFGRGLFHLQSHQSVVLDSGAFARSFQPAEKRQTTHVWFERLAEWYRAICTLYPEQVRWCVAPDVFGDPVQTYAYWCQWRALYPDIPVVPVLQFQAGRRVDLWSVRRDVQRYGAHPSLCISNPAKMDAAQWGHLLAEVCRMVKACSGASYLHLLGAGWNLVDIEMYSRIPGLDSIDSITYYLAAQRGDRWCTCPSCHQHAVSWQDIALHNAIQATRLTERTTM